jgi:hypothetical protein
MLSYTVNHTASAEKTAPPASRSSVNSQQPDADSEPDHSHHVEENVVENENQPDE